MIFSRIISTPICPLGEACFKVVNSRVRDFKNPPKEGSNLKEKIINSLFHFFLAQLVSRMLYLNIASVFAVKETLQLTQGALGGVGAILTVGAFKAYNQEAMKALSRCITSIAKIYACILKIVNPHAKVPPYVSSPYSFSDITSEISNILDKDLLESKNVLVRHLATRVSAAFIGAYIIIDNAAQLALGALAATLSLLALGQISQLNSFAFSKLAEGSGLIQDIFYYPLLIINPWALPSDTKKEISKEYDWLLTAKF